MIYKLLNCLKGVAFSLFLSIICWGQEASVPNDLIIYPKDDKETAKGRLIKVIVEAKKFIDMAAYNLKDPQIAQALIERKKQGVLVRLLIETAHYQHDFNKEAQDPVIKMLYEAGIALNGAPEVFKSKHPKGHLHARYIIIDGQTLVLTTGNFDQSTFDHCRDFAFIFHNTAENATLFKLTQSIFERDWNNKPIDDIKAGSSIILGPDDQRNRIKEFLSSAKKSIRIYAQYLNDKEIADLLISLRKKDIDIKVLMMANPTGYDKDPNKETQDQFQDAKIDVKLVNVKQDKLYMHARTVIVDDRAMVGTASLSPPSLDENREVNVIIVGKVVNDLLQQFSYDWSKAVDLSQGRQIAQNEKIDWNNIFFK